METIEQRVKRVVCDKLRVDMGQVTYEASFKDDLAADSLDQVELIMGLEEEFKDELKGDIAIEDAEKIDTVGKAIEYIYSRAGR
ncbi:MAG TPA: acyl carrier protein [Opitutae bacterium]|nr:acyl carrier protein [Opitutae bacterium]